MVKSIKNSFCDTSILIDLLLGYESTFDEFLDTQNNIYIADKVKLEMDNLIDDLGIYNFIKEKLFKAKNKKIIHISAQDFSPDERDVIQANLTQFNMSVSLTSQDTCPDLGEFASSLYAKYKNIKVVRASDNNFIRIYKHHYIFADIIFINLHSTLDEFLDSDMKSRTSLEIKAQNEKFNLAKEKYKNEKIKLKKETHKLNMKKELLMKRYNNHNL